MGTMKMTIAVLLWESERPAIEEINQALNRVCIALMPLPPGVTEIRTPGFDVIAVLVTPVQLTSEVVQKIYDSVILPAMRVTGGVGPRAYDGSTITIDMPE